MSNKEVIETLRYIKYYKADKDSDEPYALDLAIEALEEKDRQKSCDNCKNFFETECCICKKCIDDTMKYFSQWEPKEANNETN